MFASCCLCLDAQSVNSRVLGVVAFGPYIRDSVTNLPSFANMAASICGSFAGSGKATCLTLGGSDLELLF